MRHLLRSWFSVITVVFKKFKGKSIFYSWNFTENDDRYLCQVIYYAFIREIHDEMSASAAVDMQKYVSRYHAYFLWQNKKKRRTKTAFYISVVYG